MFLIKSQRSDWSWCWIYAFSNSCSTSGSTTSMFGGLGWWTRDTVIPSSCSIILCSIIHVYIISRVPFADIDQIENFNMSQHPLRNPKTRSTFFLLDSCATLNRIFFSVIGCGYYFTNTTHSGYIPSARQYSCF